LLGQLLRASGHTVKVVYDPVAALTAVEVFKPEVAVLDVGLPVMDGYELGAQLRERLGAENPCRLIALTGYGQDTDRHRSHGAGFEEHFIKPVDSAKLLALVAHP
jgi:CheY-like chemotaxis protein